LLLGKGEEVRAYERYCREGFTKIGFLTPSSNPVDGFIFENGNLLVKISLDV
jgi:hypothetical protein